MQAKAPCVSTESMYCQPTPVQKEYLSIKQICIIMDWPKSRGQDLMRQFYEKGKAIKEGRSFRLHISYFNEWRDQHDNSISRFCQPLRALNGGKT